MRVNLKKRTKGRIEFGIIYGAIAVLLLVAARFLPLLALAPQCAFQKLTGFPCPTCGSTRSIVYLARADFLSAFSMNPLITAGFVAAILALLYCAATLVFDLRRIRLSLSEREKALFRVVAVVIVLLNWFYLVFAL